MVSGGRAVLLREGPVSGPSLLAYTKGSNILLFYLMEVSISGVFATVYDMDYTFYLHSLGREM